jgi:hypothetical protein
MGSDTYDGSWIDDQPHGSGIYSFANGEKYVGEYKNGKRSGSGTYYYADGTIYEGSYINGKQEGKGKMKYSNGHIYIGDFFANKMHGKGVMSYNDGRSYTGDFRFGKLYGTGSMKNSLGLVIFEGEWKDGISVIPKVSSVDTTENINESSSKSLSGKGSASTPATSPRSGTWLDNLACAF